MILLRNYRLLTRCITTAAPTLTKQHSRDRLVALDQVGQVCAAHSVSVSVTSHLTTLYHEEKPAESEVDPLVHVFTLKNRVRVVVDETPPPSSSFAAIGVLLTKAGPSNEQPEERGATYFFEKHAFQTCQDEIQGLGGSLECTSNRDGLLYSARVPLDRVSDTVNLLHSIILHPAPVKEEQWDECKERLSFELIQMKEKPDLLLPELAHMAMFGDRGLGSSHVLSPPQKISDPKKMLDQFHKRITKPDAICVGACGVSASDLLPIIESTFGSHEMDIPDPVKDSGYHPYIGGSLYVQDPIFLHTIGLAEANPYPNHVHFMMAFPACPSSCLSDLFPAAVAMGLLGGGSSFSSGGPGKGLYSRLYTRLLSRYGFIESAHATMMQYHNAGLFGIHGSCRSFAIEQMVRLIIHELFDISSFSRSQSMELARAKNQVKSNLLMSMESLSVQLENHLKNVAYMGSVLSKQSLLSLIDQVTIKDLKRIRDRLLSIFPAFVAVGSDLSMIPSYSSVLSMIEEERTRTQ